MLLECMGLVRLRYTCGLASLRSVPGCARKSGMSVSVTGAMLSMSPCRAYCMVPVMAETSKSDMDVCTSKATSCGIWKPDS